MQNHYNLVYREEEREMIPLCIDQGVGVIPYSPLARGLLAREAGTTARSGTDPVADDLYDAGDLEVVGVVRELAKERGVAPAQIALAWLLGADGVNAPIVGATKTPAHRGRRRRRRARSDAGRTGSPRSAVPAAPGDRLT